ncbi:gag-pol polyprotein [Cucumis melo var. makuwa]|uniref:Gag-pol polyprotein n=1 Tax=Cucumis melo var. makuwa TaxID=1194695 RepID=A0A5A7U4X1_CUCMM|nr:gag-pol polyprotein [Cucumis melo var. makuwa]TYK28281.1 gag-pol polyprotein [Cucumis melo var. makuwa]
MTDENERVLIHGCRQVDNCYHWISNNSNVCHTIRDDQTWLWHRKLRHASLRHIDKAVKHEAVIGVTNINSKNKFFGGDCQVGKKIKASHKKGIHYEYSAPLSTAKWSSIEKNRTLQEMARVVIHAKSLPLHFWAEAVNTACHIHNRITTRSRTTITLYALWKGRKPNVKYFHVFGSTYYILADRECHRKWDAKSEKRIFLGHSQNSRAYKVFNNRTRVVMETINVAVNDCEQTYKRKYDDDELTPKVTMVPEVTTADALIADTSINRFEDDSKSTQKEVTADETELIPSSHV